jgi:orotidine-5'-phosphate decarboxylase
MRKLRLEERLIVAADFKPAESDEGNQEKGRDSIRREVLMLAERLYGTGVCLKVNSALRACGYDLIRQIHDRELSVFADLKLFDIDATLAIDGALLRAAKPELLTVVCAAGISAMKALKAELPGTKVLGVTALTSLKDADTQMMFFCSIEDAVRRFAAVASIAKIDGLICSPKEAKMLRAKFGILLSLNTPAIRPAWAPVPNDDQNPERIMTPAKAIKAGADRIIVGRPITKADNPREAVMRTLEEISSALK